MKHTILLTLALFALAGTNGSGWTSIVVPADPLVLGTRIVVHEDDLYCLRGDPLFSMALWRLDTATKSWNLESTVNPNADEVDLIGVDSDYIYYSCRYVDLPPRVEWVDRILNIRTNAAQLPFASGTRVLSTIVSGTIVVAEPESQRTGILDAGGTWQEFPAMPHGWSGGFMSRYADDGVLIVDPSGDHGCLFDLVTGNWDCETEDFSTIVGPILSLHVELSKEEINILTPTEILLRDFGSVEPICSKALPAEAGYPLGAVSVTDAVTNLSFLFLGTSDSMYERQLPPAGPVENPGPSVDPVVPSPLGTTETRTAYKSGSRGGGLSCSAGSGEITLGWMILLILILVVFSTTRSSRNRTAEVR